MIKVSALYPGGAGSTFNMDYYLNRHIPMVREKLGAACKSAAVEQGLGGATPGSPPAFTAMAISTLIPWRPFRRHSDHTPAKLWATSATTRSEERRVGQV